MKPFSLFYLTTSDYLPIYIRSPLIKPQPPIHLIRCNPFRRGSDAGSPESFHADRTQGYALSAPFRFPVYGTRSTPLHLRCLLYGRSKSGRCRGGAANELSIVHHPLPQESAFPEPLLLLKHLRRVGDGRIQPSH